MSLSLRTRLVLSHLLVALLSIILVTAIAGSVMLNSAIDNAADNLREMAWTAGSLLTISHLAPSDDGMDAAAQNSAPNDPHLPSTATLLSYFFASHPSIKFRLYKPDGTPLDPGEAGGSSAAPGTYPEVLQALTGEQGWAQQARMLPGGSRTLSVAIRLDPGIENYGALRVEGDLSPTLRTVRRSLIFLILASSLVAVIVSLAGWMLASNVSRPIAALTQAAVRMAGGDLDTRTRPAGPRELRRLAEVFNVMAGRLQRHLAELRTFVANASHELRTPLTVVKLRVEALRSGAREDPLLAARFLDEIESEVDRLGEMVDDLLDISRIDAQMDGGRRAKVDLGVVAEEVCQTFSIRAGRAQVEILVRTQPDLPPVHGIEDQLHRVLSNLLDNALKYTPEGGRVEIILRASRSRETVRLLVQDNGAGIPTKDLPHIFERFYRAASVSPRPGSPKGSGLGLAIARSIIENHGGKIGASSQQGAGATIWIELPVA